MTDIDTMADLKMDLEIEQAEVHRLSSRVQELERENKSLREEISKQAAALTLARHQRDEFKRNLDKERSALTRATNLADARGHGIDQIIVEADVLRTDIVRLNCELNQSRSDYTKLEEDCSIMDGRLEADKGRLTHALEQCGSEVDTVRDQIERLSAIRHRLAKRLSVSRCHAREVITSLRNLTLCDAFSDATAKDDSLDFWVDTAVTSATAASCAEIQQSGRKT
jgi:chromosome segregation ATPase